jgi:hypothetical protein
MGTTPLIRPRALVVTPQQVKEALINLRKADAINEYCWLVDHVRCIDVSDNAEFQRRFNYFYRVRGNKKWRTTFFRVFEKSKKRGQLEFAHVLNELFDRLGRVESSFSSKIIATLDPSRPVLDSIVRGRFRLHLPYYYECDRLAKTVSVYQNLEQFMSYALKTEKWIVRAFDEAFPKHRNITPMKKLDFVLWQVR